MNTLAAYRSSEATEKDFSLVLGGPLYQLLRRAKLSDGTLGLLHRRLIAAVMVMWAPLVILSAVQGVLSPPGAKPPFLEDVGFQARFLVVAPLLIIAELVVHQRMRPIVGSFKARGLIPQSQMDRFDQALEEAARWRGSILAEVTLLGIVYAAGLLFTLKRYLAMGGGGWFADPSGGPGLSYAGMWLVFVSLPLLQFLLLRWYFRLFIWTRFLWRVSMLDLDLNATHPDKAGGLGFLADSLTALTPVAAAHGVLVAGTIADYILFAGANLVDYKLAIFSGVVALTLVFASPLAVFAPRLARVKRMGLREYGALGQVYVKGFRHKWMEGETPADEPLVGTGDIQSLADLGNSYSTAEQMRLTPLRLSALVYFIAAFLAPIAPLLLTIMPAEELLDYLIGMAF